MTGRPVAFHKTHPLADSNALAALLVAAADGEESGNCTPTQRAIERLAARVGNRASRVRLTPSASSALAACALALQLHFHFPSPPSPSPAHNIGVSFRGNEDAGERMVTIMPS